MQAEMQHLLNSLLEALWPTTSDRSVANCQTMTPCRRRPRTSLNTTSNQYQKGSSNRFHATTQTLRLQPRRLYKTSTAQHRHGKPKHSKIWPSASTAAPLAWPPETTLRNSTVRVGQAILCSREHWNLLPGALCNLRLNKSIFRTYGSRTIPDCQASTALSMLWCSGKCRKLRPVGQPSTGHGLMAHHQPATKLRMVKCADISDMRSGGAALGSLPRTNLAMLDSKSAFSPHFAMYPGFGSLQMPVVICLSKMPLRLSATN
mmetsp:Transcript_174583/g.554083  ORF Transcript_174583/g.554083 Transcript_174583/m.554083 type:complete len:261 (+) Transcript_174583:43-825(+)